VKTNPNKKTLINIVTLGCAKNLVDSERLARQLELNGFKILNNSDSKKARIIVINTCGFIEDAKRESINTILSFINAKAKGIVDKVYVIGCLSQRYKQELKTEIKEVDSYFGVNSLEEIIKALSLEYKSQLLNEREISTLGHYSYLKISEGCNRHCAFCVIPNIRGKYHSQSIESLLSEAKFLSNKKVKELILIAQDLTYYGKDLGGKCRLPELIIKLAEINGIEWIRLHYAYPSAFPKEIIQLLKSLPKLCKYLDIPLQHISDPILKKMKRNINESKTRGLIELLRKEVPNIAIRTTLLVGYPGETERDFEKLIEFVKWARFDRLGVFTYSHEEDTFAYKNFNDDISNSVKKMRSNYIMDIQSAISFELNQQKIGKKYKIIIDRREGEDYIGRTEFDSPEVDNEVIIRKCEQNLKPGMFVNARIISASEYDIEARLEND
jgi:ribosomal protein S12 methylthiotransferase